MHNYQKLSSVSLTVLLALGLCAVFFQPAYAQSDETASKLQAADNAVKQAFNSVLDAEKAGANVTGLLYQLNVATDLLAQAENAYRTGDYNTAAANSGNVNLVTQQVTVAAQTAKETAESSTQNSFWTTVGLSVAGSLVFVLSLFFVWRWVKQRYIGGLDATEPEVVNQ
jgi:predicted PurR-regulated permease PerM